MRTSPPAEAGGVAIGVIGAAGGAGTSTLAAAVAMTAPGKASLIDANPAGGGIDLLLGLEGEPGARWPDLQLRTGNVDAEELRHALPATPGGVSVLAQARSTVPDPFRMTSQDLTGAVRALREGRSVTVVVVDLPSWSPDLAEAVAVLDLVVVVVPAEVRPAAAAAALARELAGLQVPAVGVLRHRAWSGLDPADIERITRLELVAEIRVLRHLCKQAELHGIGAPLPRALRLAATSILEEAGLPRAGGGRPQTAGSVGRLHLHRNGVAA